MKKKMFWVVVISLGASFSLGAATGVKITAELKQQNIIQAGKTMSKEVVTYKGTTYVPLREFANLVGVNIDYKEGNIYLGDDINTPSISSYNYNNPAPIGTPQIGYSIHYKTGKYTAEIKITEVIRGNEALEIIKANNKYGTIIGDNEEYLIAKISAKILTTEKDGAIPFDTNNFIAYSGNNKSYAMAPIYRIPNQLSATLTKNGSTEGYVYLEVNKDDKHPKLGLRTSDSNIITKGIWFALAK